MVGQYIAEKGSQAGHLYTAAVTYLLVSYHFYLCVDLFLSSSPCLYIVDTVSTCSQYLITLVTYFLDINMRTEYIMMQLLATANSTVFTVICLSEFFCVDVFGHKCLVFTSSLP